MADDQPVLSGGAALRAQSKVPPPTPVPAGQVPVQETQEPAPVGGGAALRAQSKVPLPGAVAAPGAATAPGSVASQFGQGAFEGAASVLGAPAWAAHGVNRLLAPLGFHPPVEDPALGFQGRDTPADWLSTFKGYGYDPTQQPKGLVQELARGAGQATSTLPLAAYTEMGALPALAYTYGPGLAGDLFHHYAPGWNPLWASLPAALTLTGAGRLWTEASARSAAAKAAEEAAQAEAAATATRQAHEAGAATFTRGLQEQQDVAQAQAGRAKGFTEADAAKRLDSEHTAAANHLLAEHAGADADREAVANSLGQSQTVQKGGEALQDAARSWKKVEFPKQLKDAEDKMYDGIAKIPEDAKGDLTNFRDSITNSFYKAGELEPAAQQLRSRMPDRLESALDAIGAKQGLKPGEIPEATLGDMKKLRSILGDAMTSPKLTEGVDAGKMNELYRALSSDMEGAIGNAAGPQGVAQFKKFNEEARRLYGLAGGPVSDIISTTDKAGETIMPGDAVNSILKGSDKDGTRLTQLGSEPTLDKGLKEVAASQLRTGKGAGVVQGDPDKFFAGLAPESKTALFGDVPAGKLQDAIDRRVAAERTAGEMKGAADKDYARMQAAAANISTQSLKGQEAVRQDLREAQSKTGVGLRQAEENAKATAKATAARAEELQRQARSVGGKEWPFWFRNLPALAGGFAGGEHLLSPGHLFGELGAQLPEGGTHLASALTAGATYLGGKGAQELWKNPMAARNLLVGGVASKPGGQP